MMFNSKKILMSLLVVIICLFSVTCVSAGSDDNEVYQVSADNNGLELSHEDSDNSKVEVSQDDSKLSASASVSEVRTASKSAYDQFVDDINTKSYVELNEDITIKDTIQVFGGTIDGKGHTINGNGRQIFSTKSGSTVTIKNLVFRNGESVDGGAIYSHGNLYLENCGFYNCKAKNHGGAICAHALNSPGKVTIKNCYFEDNTVTNTREARGGAFYCYDCSCEFIDSTFKGNHAYANPYSYGGAIYLHNKNHIISGCNFYSNTVKNHGGSILAFKQVKVLTVNNCVFKYNKATKEDGGAISFGGKTININNCVFDSNYAYEDGGAMDVYSKGSYTIHVNIKNCDFKSNSGRKTAGALYVGRKAKFNIKNSRFTKNKSTIGGAIFCEGYSATIANCVFTSNRATKMGNVKSKGGYKMKHCGGAIYNKHSTVKVTSSQFYSNKATYGGAIFNKATLRLYRNLMKSNIATLYGGGLFHDTGKLTLFKNSFLFNKGKYQGLYSRTDVPLKGNILKPKQKKIN